MENENKKLLDEVINLLSQVKAQYNDEDYLVGWNDAVDTCIEEIQKNYHNLAS